MRKLLMTIAAVVSTGLFAATSASAASRWTCEGPEFVCGSTSHSATKSSSREDAGESSSRATRVAHTRHQATAYLDDDQPVRRRARHAVTARASNDDDAPVRHRGRRSGGGDEGGGSSFSGNASYYWEPQALASGGRFNPNALTAAHKTLPFGTRVRVTNQRNGQSVVVTINDRGPYVGGRVIDLSAAAAGAISMKGAGVAPVSVTVLGRS